MKRLPQGNGIAERLHRTLLDEHFRIQGRIKFYESLEGMQNDIDNYLQHIIMKGRIRDET